MASIETLYDQNHAIRLQSYASTSNESKCTADRIRQVRIVLRMQTRKAPPHRRDLVMRLTDDTDYFILYTLTIGEEDYKGLRREQGLLVDFNTFPSSFICLLKLCEQPATSHSTSQYILNLIQTDASSSASLLKVVETNAFRQITHLSLKFISGNCSDIMDYMSECLVHYKDLYENTRSELSNTRSVVTGTLEAAKIKMDRLETKNAELLIQRERNGWYRQAKTNAENRWLTDQNRVLQVEKADLQKDKESLLMRVQEYEVQQSKDLAKEPGERVKVPMADVTNDNKPTYKQIAEECKRLKHRNALLLEEKKKYYNLYKEKNNLLKETEIIEI